MYTGVAVGYYGQISDRRMDTGEKGVDSVKYELRDKKGNVVTNTDLESLKTEDGQKIANENWKYVKAFETWQRNISE